MVFALYYVAIWHMTVVMPDSRQAPVFTTLDMCREAEQDLVRDMGLAGAYLLTHNCQLRQLAPLGR